jgi:uncharacterized protein with FMN-binding domain
LRRALVAIGGTTAGLAALLSYRSGPNRPLRSAGPATGSTTTTDAPTSEQTSTTAAPMSVPTPVQPSVQPATTAAPTTAAPTTTPPIARAGVFDGAVETTDFGPVQVRLTFRGGRIVDVQALALPFDRPRSRAISAFSAPVLRGEVLAAQGNQIDSVSGATYTSDGYAQSVASALRRSHG